MYFTLVADGSSDAVLRHLLAWLLRQHLAADQVQFQFADLGGQRPKNLAEKLRLAVDFYPCDLLFVHRDAERSEPQHRRGEIRQAITEAGLGEATVCVIPVRMTEAWLLFNASAVRRAAGNPNGREPLELPMPSPEDLPNPKGTLHEALKVACGLKGRRLKKFNLSEAVHRLAENIDDFSPLRNLKAFQSLEMELESVLRSMGWIS